MFQSFEMTGGPEHVAERVGRLRVLLAERGIDAFLIPRADEHQGEYVPASAERLKWLTGFSGSAGIAIVARKAAVLFTDGRYTVQARAETDANLFEISLTPRARIHEWITATLAARSVIGFDPWLHTAGEVKRLTAALADKGIKLKPLARNIVDLAWGRERPPAPSSPLVVHPVEIAGRSTADKIADIQRRLKDDGQHAAVLTLTDSICWLFNIRGADVAHNPVVLAFAIVNASGKAELFVAPEKLTRDVRTHLSATTRLSAPAQFTERLKSLRAGGKRVRLDADTGAFAIQRALGAASAVSGGDPCILPKAIKNDVEIAGARAAHVRDGAAMVRFLAWFEDAARAGTLDEITAVETLEEMRQETGALLEISFPTISGSGAHGAIVHYRVTRASNRVLKLGELFLLDSGAQYRDGTTDITRTLAVGQPSDEMVRRCTAVLKGHIAIATARFPKGTRGIDLDPFARRALWDMGADYDHGTGHGIGSFLNVHEGPQSISRAGMATLQPGMLLSNEPGFYKEGSYGIRIENVVLVRDAELISGGGERPMMSFETLTLAPFDRALIAVDLLSADERRWIDAYHARIAKTLTPLIDGAAQRWLKKATAPL